MSKIVKKKMIDVLIESTLKQAGISKNSKKPLINESQLGDLYTKVYTKASDTWDVPATRAYKEAIRNFFKKAKKGEVNSSDYFDGNGNLIISKEDFVNEFGSGEITESKSSRKPLINEDIQKELSNFNKLVNYTPKK